jgi:hypothetical protein
LKQGLEQNSLIDIYSQELFLSDCQDAIEFVASSGLNRSAQLLTGDLGERRELEKKAKAEGGCGAAVRDLPLSIALMLC